MNIEEENKVETNAHGHQVPRYDDVNVPLIVILGVVSATVTFVSIVFVQGLYYHWEAAQIREKEYGKPVFAAQEIARQKESLTGYRQSKDGKTRSIPIEYAMKLVLEQNKNSKKESHAHDDHANHESKGENVEEENVDGEKGEGEKGEGEKQDPDVKTASTSEAAEDATDN